MKDYPETIKQVVDFISRLPGLGPKTAQRLIFYLLYNRPNDLKELANLLNNLREKILVCSVCQNFSETNPCAICRDEKRNHGVICIVAKPQDLLAIERIGEYEGTYHILGGTIDPLEGITPNLLTIKELLIRIQKNNVREVILALNPDMPGETTMMYLNKILKKIRNLKVTRLARGLPVGSDLEYADEITLSNALKGRREV